MNIGLIMANNQPPSVDDIDRMITQNPTASGPPSVNDIDQYIINNNIGATPNNTTRTLQPAPPTNQQSWPHYGGGLFDAITDGAAFGFGGQLEGLEKAIIDAAFDTHPDMDFEQVRTTERDRFNEERRDFGRDNFVSDAIATGVGGAASTIATGGVLAAGGREMAKAGLSKLGGVLDDVFTYGGSFLKRVAQNVAGGATFGGAYQYAKSEDGEGVPEAAAIGAIAAPIGAAIGHGFGKVLAAGARKLGFDRVVDPVSNQFSPEMREFLSSQGIDPDTIPDEVALEFLRVFRSSASERENLAEFGRSFERLISKGFVDQSNQSRAAMDAITERLDGMERGFGEAVQRGNEQASAAATRLIRPDPGNLTAAERDFNVRLSPGQRMGRTPEGRVRQQREEDMRQGQFGSDTEITMRGFDRDQAADIGEATENIGRQSTGIAGGAGGAMRSLQGVRDAIIRRRQSEREVASGRYERAEIAAGDLTINADNWTSVSGAIRNDLMRRNFGVLLPEVSGALRRLDQLAEMDPEFGPSLASINQVRKDMRDFRDANANDRQGVVMGQAIRTLDDALDRALEFKLFRGDPKLAEDLQAARAAYAEYKQRFSAEYRGDLAGGFLDKMARGEKEPVEVASFLFGQAKLGATGDAIRLTRRLKDILEPEEFQLVRRAAWDFITERYPASSIINNQRGAISTQEISRAVMDFSRPGERGYELGKELFSKSELMNMQRFAVLLNAIPYERAGNQSGSGHAVMRGINRIAGDQLLNAAERTATIAGASVGGGTGAAVAGTAARGATSFLKIMNDAARDRKTAEQLQRELGQLQALRPVTEKIIDWSRAIGRLSATTATGTDQQ